MTDTINVPRELLSRVCHTDNHTRQTARRELRNILLQAPSAPRQPEGEGLEVVAWQDAENPLYTTGEKRQMHGWATDGYPVVELCRLSDAQRAIAELREVNRIQLEIATVHGAACVGIRKQRDKLKAENERLRNCLRKANGISERFERNWYLVSDERDTLRTQLAEARELLSRLEDYRIKWLKPTKVELEVVAWLEANK